MITLRKYYKILLLILIFPAAILPAGIAGAAVPLRISVKFILDVNGNRPAVGNLNTDAEIWNEINQGVSILRDVITEYSIDTVEFTDLAGLSQWYTADACGQLGNLRNAAIANPVTYHWRTDALNIYINGGSSSACSDFPPNNNMILMNQWCGNTPSCVLHEMGHSFNLFHTHEGGGNDACSDTLADNSGWATKDQMAQSNFGTTFANLTAAQQDQVNLTWNNVMSYHVNEPQRRISPCQMNRVSDQGYNDRNRLYTRIPIYVNYSPPLFCFLWPLTANGSFACPYPNAREAVNAGGLSNRVLVLQQGSYTVDVATTINTNVEMVTRSGPSTVNAPGVQLYSLPVDLANSDNPQVKAAVRAAQKEDSDARIVLKNAEAAAAAASTLADKDAIIANAKKVSMQHRDNAIAHLLDAEQYAAGNERIAIHLELAQRYRDSENCKLAIKYFSLVADATDQQYLKEEALREADKCQQKLTPLGSPSGNGGP